MGFKSFKSYGFKISENKRITIAPLVPENPPPKKIRVIVGGSGNNNIAYSDDNGVNWTLPSNQPFTQRGFNCGFDGKRIVMGGNYDIAYSDDYGETWVSTDFTSIQFVYRMTYIKETNIWFASGYNISNNRTLAYSSDGIIWNLVIDTPFTGGRSYDIVYNGSVYIGVGFNGNYPMATSPDGITWTQNTTYSPASSSKNSYVLIYDGSRYIFGGDKITNGSGRGNIATSSDGITWDDTQTSNLPFNVQSIAYNGVDTYVAGGNNGGILNYWSNDLKTWTPTSNNLLTASNYVLWNGTYFIATGTTLSGSTTTIIYSEDGKTWNASNNSPYSLGFSISSITY